MDKQKSLAVVFTILVFVVGFLTYVYTTNKSTILQNNLPQPNSQKSLISAKKVFEPPLPSLNIEVINHTNKNIKVDTDILQKTVIPLRDSSEVVNISKIIITIDNDPKLRTYKYTVKPPSETQAYLSYSFEYEQSNLYIFVHAAEIPVEEYAARLQYGILAGLYSGLHPTLGADTIETKFRSFYLDNFLGESIITVSFL